MFYFQVIEEKIMFYFQVIVLDERDYIIEYKDFDIRELKKLNKYVQEKLEDYDSKRNYNVRKIEIKRWRKE